MKHKPKTSLKIPPRRPLNASRTLQKSIPEEVCCIICHRVQFGTIVRLGYDKWRHEECEVGSQEWKVYYQQLPYTKQLPLREFYKHFYEGRTF